MPINHQFDRHVDASPAIDLAVSTATDPIAVQVPVQPPIRLPGRCLFGCQASANSIAMIKSWGHRQVGARRALGFHRHHQVGIDIDALAPRRLWPCHSTDAPSHRVAPTVLDVKPP